MASCSQLRRFAAPIFAAAVAATLAVGLSPSASAAPDPTSISQLTAQLATLSRQNEHLTEQFNRATIDVAAKQAAAATAKRAADRADAKFVTARNQLRTTIVDQYKGTGLGSAAALLTSTSSAQYLDQLATLQLLSARRVAITTDLKAAKASADSARGTAAKLLAVANQNKNALAGQRVKVQADQDKYTRLLGTLTAAQRQTFLNAAGGTPVAVTAKVALTTYTALPAPSKQAAIAVQYALAQLGKPYVWGAAGPGAFDCSGLTMMAWAAAGVHLSHYAPTQFTAGHRVPLNQIAPGDLLFYYPDIGHVTIYIGGGMMVSAPTTGDVVKIVSVASFAGDYQGAVRLP